MDEEPGPHHYQTPKVTEIRRLGFLSFAQTIQTLPDNVFLHPTHPDAEPDPDPPDDVAAVA